MRLEQLAIMTGDIDMQIIKVHFGGTKPQDMEYFKQADGMAEVWLYNNIREETDADGNTEFVADGVMLKTCLSAEEIETRRDNYFTEEPTTVTEEPTTVEDLVEAINILTSIVLGER